MLVPLNSASTTISPPSRAPSWRPAGTAPEATTTPRQETSTGRIRPVRHPKPSLAQRRLAAGQPIVSPEGNSSPLYRAFKRGLDIVGALVLLLLLSPVLVTTLLVLLVTTRGKPLFFQERLGYLGQPFTLLKFRTMVVDAAAVQHRVANQQDGPIFKNRRDPRITRIGRFLRTTSIDEMPQLIHVLLGQMSLVGPRPPVAKEVAQYEPWQRRRLAVKPGLTCLWQVSGRSDVGFLDWVRMDLWYVAHQGIGTDLGLLVRTPWCVLTGRGAY